MYQKARDASVPTDTIDRAVKRGTGELEGVRYEAVSYEGYAPAGVAVMVECLTDNRNRTGAEIRSIFTRNAGTMAEPGAVSWQFERKGVITIPHKVEEDEVMAVALDAGGQDLRDDGEEWTVISEPAELPSLVAAVEAAGIPTDSSEVTWVPTTTVEVSDPATARKVLNLLDLLEEHDDVQSVVANFDIPDEILSSLAS
jgi:YebC/PmpR family DNA-binding regulatory protein